MESTVPLTGMGSNNSTPRVISVKPVSMRVPSYNAPDAPGWDFDPVPIRSHPDTPEQPQAAPAFSLPKHSQIAPAFSLPKHSQAAPAFSSPQRPIESLTGSPRYLSKTPVLSSTGSTSYPLRSPAARPSSYQSPLRSPMARISRHQPLIRRDPFSTAEEIEPLKIESPNSTYLFDSYVDHRLENELKRVMSNHDRAGNLDINGVYDLGTQRSTLVNLTDIHLSTEAELRNGTMIDGQTYIFPIDKSIYDRRVRMSTYDSPPYSIDRKVTLTHQTIGNHRYIVISPEDDLNLTPLWGVWTNQACPFPKPCNITFKLQCGPGQIVKETYNLSTSGINTDSASFVALPDFLLQTGDKIRLIFYLEPKVSAPDSTPYSGISFERENLLRKIIIQITPAQSGGRVRRFLRSVWYGNNNNV